MPSEIEGKMRSRLKGNNVKENEPHRQTLIQINEIPPKWTHETITLRSQEHKLID